MSNGAVPESGNTPPKRPCANVMRLVERGIDWAIEEERQGRHTAPFVVESRLTADTSETKASTPPRRRADFC